MSHHEAPAGPDRHRPDPVPQAQTLHELTDADGRVMATVRRTTLPSGMRVVTEQMAGAMSASIGVWVGVGSADEDEARHGCSHFLEHLLFKGTGTRSAFDISIALDAVGGEFNAFTAKEYTCFHARVLDADLPLAIDVLGDMVVDSRLDPADVEAERDVILDEIAMHDDDPDDVAHNLLATQAWGEGTPLGRPIAGTETSIAALTRDQVHDFYRTHYRPERLVVSVAGHLDHDEVVDRVRRAFSGGGFLEQVAEPVSRLGTGAAVPVHPGQVRAERPFEQANVVLAVEGLPRDHPSRFALGVLNTALGGGTSSRLFQEVRERRGLAYSVFSFATHHADTGLVGVSVGCLPERLDEVLRVVRGELTAVAAHGIDADELERGKGQLRGGLVLGLEDSASRMARIGKAELVHDGLLSVPELLERIDAVTEEEVRAVAAQVLSRPEVLAVVGPTSSR